MKKISAVILFLLLICCFLSGCADLLRNDEMDEEVARFIKALNEDDADQIYLSMYPDVVTREEFDESYGSVGLFCLLLEFTAAASGILFLHFPWEPLSTGACEKSCCLKK